MQDINFKRPNDHFEKLINQLNEDFGPYADTTYGTLLTWWDSFNDLLFAELNGNVLVLSSYPSDGRAKQLSIIGAHEADKTIKMALDWLQDNHLEPMLHFLPEYIIDALKKDGPGNDYDISADRDISEYILSAEEHKDLIVPSLGYNRSKIRHLFQKFSDVSLEEVDLSSKDERDQILRATHSWSSVTQNDSMNIEHTIISQSLHNHQSIKILCAKLMLNKKMEGFVLFKLQPHNYANINHLKVNYEHKYTFMLTLHLLAKMLHENYSVEHLNIEQDLGVEGLRTFKQRQRPVKLLHKYSLTRRQN